MRLFFQIILALVVFVWIVAGAVVWQGRRALGSSGASLSMTADSFVNNTMDSSDLSTILSVGASHVRVAVANTNELRSRGLSGTKEIAEDEGMLFVFDKPEIQRFWMPDMHFPIDIVWVDQDKKIIGVSERAVPLQDLSQPIYYISPAPTKYVLEVSAGFFQRHALKKGMTVSW